MQESVFFRLGTFLWIENLAAPDMLFYWGQSIPIIADPNGQGGVVMDKGILQWLATVPRFFYLGPFFNLLPIIAVVLMIVQQIVMTPPPQDEQQAAQFKMMRYMMVVIGIMFYKVAAGLCMYIIISTVWGLCERRFLPKKQTAPALPAATGQRPTQRAIGPQAAGKQGSAQEGRQHAEGQELVAGSAQAGEEEITANGIGRGYGCYFKTGTVWEKRKPAKNGSRHPNAKQSCFAIRLSLRS